MTRSHVTRPNSGSCGFGSALRTPTTCTVGCSTAERERRTALSTKPVGPSHGWS